MNRGSLLVGSTPTIPKNIPIHIAHKLRNQNFVLTKPTVANAKTVNAHNSGTPIIISKLVYQGRSKKTKQPHNNPLIVEVVTAALMA